MILFNGSNLVEVENFANIETKYNEFGQKQQNEL
jgi:hypothetical protein